MGSDGKALSELCLKKNAEICAKFMSVMLRHTIAIAIAITITITITNFIYFNKEDLHIKINEAAFGVCLVSEALTFTAGMPCR